MKTTLLTLALLTLPAALLAYHYGPGRSDLARDQVHRITRNAGALEAAGDWTAALAAYEEALGSVPDGDADIKASLQLAHARARMHTGELPEAMDDLDRLLDSVLEQDPQSPLAAPIRNQLATTQYYNAWLMRLEGATAEEWTPTAEAARQNFRLLAENSAGTESDRHERNLESAVRLLRMDLSELEALPLPKFCEGCKNVCQKCRSQSQARNRSETPKEPKDGRGAGFNESPRGGS